MSYQILVVDDERVPTAAPEGVTVEVYKTSESALEELQRRLRVNQHTDELWLDYSLGGGDDVFPILRWLVAVAEEEGNPLPVGEIFAHSGTASGRGLVLEMLKPHYEVTQGDLPQERQ